MHCLTIFASLTLYVFVVSSEYSIFKTAISTDYMETLDMGEYQRLGDKYYLINETDKANWMTAWQNCRKENGYLASFDSAEEMHIISDALKKLNLRHAWTSGNDLGKSRKFVWATNANAVGTNLFLEGEPNNNNEHCLSLRKRDCEYGLNDNICSDNYAYICQIKPLKIVINIA